jgi:hypothetical protein
MNIFLTSARWVVEIECGGQYKRSGGYFNASPVFAKYWAPCTSPIGTDGPLDAGAVIVPVTKLMMLAFIPALNLAVIPEGYK